MRSLRINGLGLLGVVGEREKEARKLKRLGKGTGGGERKDRREREKIKYGRESELNRWQNNMEVCGCRIPT
jgi:hypothetical protein